MSLIARVLGVVNPLEAVIVSLKTGDSVKGLLVDRTRTFMVLRAAQIMTERPTDHQQIWVRAAGDVVIPTDNVDYYQTGLSVDVIE